jgi:hypothetical protein
MGSERNVLAWAALITSIIACAPCTCLLGVIALSGVATGLDSPESWQRTDTLFLIGFTTLTCASLIAGLVLFGWGLRTVWLANANPAQQL